MRLKDSAPVKRALLALKTRPGGPLSDGQNALCALISHKALLIKKYLSKKMTGSRCGSRFAFWGDLDRQRRRRVRLQGS
jgi:hypothetical protein